MILLVAQQFYWLIYSVTFVLTISNNPRLEFSSESACIFCETPSATRNSFFRKQICAYQSTVQARQLLFGHHIPPRSLQPKVEIKLGIMFISLGLCLRILFLHVASSFPNVVGFTLFQASAIISTAFLMYRLLITLLF